MVSSQNVPVGKVGGLTLPAMSTAATITFSRMRRFDGLAEVRFCKRSLAQDTLKAWHESRCGSIGAHGVLGEQSAPNKHIFAHTLCARNVACLGGNYAAILRVIFTRDSRAATAAAAHGENGLRKFHVAKAGWRRIGIGFWHGLRRQVHAEQNVF